MPIYLANDYYSGQLRVAWVSDPADGTMDVNAVPSNFPTLITLNKGMDTQAVYEVTGYSGTTSADYALTGVTWKKGYAGDQAANSTINCLNNEEFFNQYTKLSDDYAYLAATPTAAFLSRQAIINGNFDVWQRGVSFTANSVYTADRWTYYDSGASRTVTRDTDVPDISSLYSLKTVVATGGSNKVAAIIQRCEGSTSGRFSGKSVTVSFYVKASAAAGTLNGGLIYISYASALDNFTTTEYVIGATFTPTTSWQLVTKTLALPATSTSGYSIANGFFLSLQAGCTDNTNLTVRFAQVQLCAGDVALPFQPKSFEEELRACQRYYEKSYTYTAAIGATTEVGMYDIVDWGVTGRLKIPYKVSKRISPTVTFYSPGTGTVAKYRDFTSGADFDIAIAGGGSSSDWGISANLSSHGSAGETVGVHWTADAEL